MSRLNTKNALQKNLYDNLPTGVLMTDISHKNQSPVFNPEGKDIWLKTYVIEASSETTGKSTTDSDHQHGFMQIDVFIPLTSKAYDNVLTTAIDELASTFKFGTQLVYNGQTVSILDNTSPESKEDGSWFKRIITINYLTISTRV